MTKQNNNFFKKKPHNEGYIDNNKDISNEENKDISNEKLIELFKNMLLIRRFEERAGQLYGMGKIGGFCHLYIGQEAIIVGAECAKKTGDKVITGYRDHGHMLACGMTANGVMAELTGRSQGYSKGKGGSMHMFSTQNNFYGGHGIVGAQVPIGAGLAFASKYRNDNSISFTYFGDGAANQGQVYEAMNMAKLWSLPIIFIVENNQYAMGTSILRSSGQSELFKRGQSFGIEGRQIDGMDVINVRNEMLNAAEFVRSGNGPILIEAKTYRYRGHSMSDPAKYRSKEEVDKIKENNDPIENCRKLILTKKACNEEQLKEINKDIRDIIKQAAEFSLASPLLPKEELYKDVLI